MGNNDVGVGDAETIREGRLKALDERARRLGLTINPMTRALLAACVAIRRPLPAFVLEGEIGKEFLSVSNAKQTRRAGIGASNRLIRALRNGDVLEAAVHAMALGDCLATLQRDIWMHWPQPVKRNMRSKNRPVTHRLSYAGMILQDYLAAERSRKTGRQGGKSGRKGRPPRVHDDALRKAFFKLQREWPNLTARQVFGLVAEHFGYRDVKSLGSRLSPLINK